MFTFWGTGTTLYGKSDIKSDRSYTATEWFVLFLLPIIPLASYRVYSKNSPNPLNPALLLVGVFGSKQKLVLREIELNKKQVKETYLIAYSLLAGFGLIIYSITQMPNNRIFAIILLSFVILSFLSVIYIKFKKRKQVDSNSTVNSDPIEELKRTAKTIQEQVNKK